jgi:enamine deaminase RidA (YjgF/YER057c/UK114 family)
VRGFFCSKPDIAEKPAVALRIKAHNPPTLWTVPEPFRTIYSHGTEVASGARLLFVSGQFGVAADGSLPAEFAEQAALAMANIESLLAAAGMAKSNLVKLNYYLTRASDAPVLAAIRRERWAAAEPPAVTALVVSALARPEYLIEIEAVAAA